MKSHLRLLSRVLWIGVLAAATSTTSAAQQTGRYEEVVTRIVNTVPKDGAVGVKLDRSAYLRFSGPLRTDTVTSQSIFVTTPTGTVTSELAVTLNRHGVRITFPYYLPGKSTVEVTVVGDLLIDHSGRPVDGDGDGKPGGTLVFAFQTGDEVPPPISKGSAVILGYVFDENGAPLQGAKVDAVFYPASDDTNPPPAGAIRPTTVPAITDSNGYFEYTTRQFVAEEEFLVRVRKAGRSEALRYVKVLAGGCWRIKDAFLQKIQTPVFVSKAVGATLHDDSGRVVLEIPPNALQEDSDVGVTVLASDDYIRDELPLFVAPGTFTDVSGVFGDATTTPVKFTVDNIYNLPIGTRVPFGKIDHNTLEWIDLRDAYDGPPPVPDSFLGTVVDDGTGTGGTVIEVEFDHFCTVCTSYCKKIPEPKGEDGSGGSGSGDGAGTPCDPGDCCRPGLKCGNSILAERSGALYEFVPLPSFREFGKEVGLSLGYSSVAASPSITLSARVDYNSTRPVERTFFAFSIEGTFIEAAYDRSQDNQKPIGTWIWNGRNGLGELLATGSYSYSIVATSLNANVAVALPEIFGEGGEDATAFNVNYPGLISLRAEEIVGRAALVNLQSSPYGAGWSVVNEHRLYFDSDGCILLLFGAGDWRHFEPDPVQANLWVSPTGDESSLVRNPEDGTFVRRLVDGTRYVFAPTGRVDRIEDRFGFSTQFSYAADRLTGITTPTGFWWSIDYDASGRLSAISDSAGRATAFVVDSAGDLESVTDATGSTRSFQYDGHLLVRQTGPADERSEYEYSNGRIVETRAYDVGGGALLRRRNLQPSDLQGEIGLAAELGLGADILNPIPLVELYASNYTDGRGFVESVEYSSAGQVLKESDPLGRITEYVYASDRRLTERRRPDGSSTRYQYDSLGRLELVQEFNSQGQFYSDASFEYEGPFDELSRIVDAEGKQTVFLHDGLGNTRFIEDHSGNRREFRYGSLRAPGRPSEIRTPVGDRLELEYDAHGNLQAWKDFPDPQSEGGRTYSFAYDPTGSIESVMDPEGSPTSYTRDAFNRVTSVQDALTATTIYEYVDQGCGCASANLTRVEFANGTEISMVYDGLDRLVSNTDQLGRKSSFAYDAEGNTVRATNREGETVDYQYDAIGRIERKDVQGQGVTLYAYDELGYLAGAVDAQCELLFEHDSLGRLTSAMTFVEIDLGGGQTYPVAHQIDYEYDAVGRRTGLSESLGAADFDYKYDDQHRLELLTVNRDDSLVWQFGYDAAGRRTTLSRPGVGVTSTNEYDQIGQVTSTVHSTQPPIILSHDQFDGVQNLESGSYQGSSRSLALGYEYDDVSQVANAMYSSTFGDARVDVSYNNYDAANRVQDDTEFQYQYDMEGRLAMQLDLDTGVMRSFIYDAEDQLLEVQESVDVDGSPEVVLSAQYLYDPLGRRVCKSVNGVATTFLYDGHDILHELDGQSRLERTYVQGPAVDEHLAMIDAVTSTVYHYYRDRIGSIVAVSDDGGNIIQEYAYEEYGGQIAEFAPAFSQPYSYTGRERDLESGLYYYRARYYEPRVGRFLSEDPIGLSGGINFYAYVGNNPVNAADPYGLWVVWIPYIINAVDCLGGAFVPGWQSPYPASTTCAAAKTLYDELPRAKPYRHSTSCARNGRNCPNPDPPEPDPDPETDMCFAHPPMCEEGPDPDRCEGK